MDKASLEDLLRRARRNDRAALHALVEAYSPRVFGLLYRLTGSRDTAEDLLQETFLRLVRTIGEYEHSGKFEAWLFRIAANLARDHARRNRRRAGSSPPADGSGCDGRVVIGGRFAAGEDPRSSAQRHEDGQRVAAALERMTDIDREILLLRHFSALSFREIAELLGVPLGTALARAHRAANRLRAELDERDT